MPQAGKQGAELLHEHFVLEEKLALPPLGILTDLAENRITPEMKTMITLSEDLKA